MILYSVRARIARDLPGAMRWSTEISQYVKEKHDVNMLSCVCAIDRATLTSLMDYWNPEVGVCGITELVGNAIVLEGETRGELDEGLRTMLF